MPTTREMLEAWPTPIGNMSEVGRCIGVTRERIRQLCNKLGIEREAKLARLCKECGCEIGSGSRTGLCLLCWRESKRITLPCDYCGHPHKRLLSLMKWKRKDPRYKGKLYCSTKCSLLALQKAEWWKASPCWHERRPHILTHCCICGEGLVRKPRWSEKNNRAFCSSCWRGTVGKSLRCRSG